MGIIKCEKKECSKYFDMDGFVEHGKPSLFLCECGTVYDMQSGRSGLKLVQVPREEVDLSGLDLEKLYVEVGERYKSMPEMSRGGFINKSRWKPPQKQ
jgi:hypothetical protein